MAVKLRISRNSLVFRILKNPWGRAFIVAVPAAGHDGDRRLRLLLFPVLAHDRGGAAGPARSRTRRLLYAAPRPVMVGEEITRRGHRGVSEALRLFVVEHQPDGLVSGSSRRGRDQPRTGRVRSGRRGDQDRGRPRDADHFPARSHRAHSVSAGAGADQQSLRQEAREAPHRGLRRYSQGDGERAAGGRRQALSSSTPASIRSGSCAPPGAI